MAYYQTPEDLYKHFKEQISFLIKDARSFDKGNTPAAKRLASTLRNFVKESPNSLLTLLHKKDILFYDTGIEVSRTMVFQVGDKINIVLPHTAFIQYIVGRTKKKEKFFIPLDDVPSDCQNVKVSFNQWWGKLIYIDSKGYELTRKTLVESVAEQDGGVHIDKKLNANYAAISRHKSHGIFQAINGHYQQLEGIELAMIRQIVHEFLKSIADEFPQEPLLKKIPIKGFRASLRGKPRATEEDSN